MADNVFISRKGYQKMLEEIAELKRRRPIIAQEIKEAMEKGDLKENAEYHAAKEDLAHVQRRIAELEGKIGSARLLEDQANIPSDKVYIGATVVVTNLDTDEETTYQIVGADEADINQGLISVSAPLARALIGKSIGDEVVVNLPAGTRRYEIGSIEFR